MTQFTRRPALRFRTLLYLCLGTLASCASSRSASEQGLVCSTNAKAVALSVDDTAFSPVSRVAPTPPSSSPPGELYVSAANSDFIQDLVNSAKISAQRGAPYRILALSAGGQWGAYGAGVVRGLRDNPNPELEFNMVTGISTGAMLAPLVFLHDDATAKMIYTTLSSDQVYRTRSRLELIFSNSLVDTAPLKTRLEQIITPDFITRIAGEGAKGRILAVQSVDIDLGQSIVFDLTAIAQGKRECGDAVSSRDCIIRAILAAAAIPVAFPPVFINGEMFVDGGLRQHAFLMNVTDFVLRHPSAAAQVVPNMRGKEIRDPCWSFQVQRSPQHWRRLI